MRIDLVPNESHLRRLRQLPNDLAFDMSDPALLRTMGQTHRDQVRANFQTEGATGARGPWQALSPKYAKRKARLVGARKILDLTGDTKRRFTMAGHPDYIERYVPAGPGKGIFMLGARSDVAAAHLHGNPRLVTSRVSLRKLFGGVAKRLPVRDMITKTTLNIRQLQSVMNDWYIARLKQRFRAGRALGVTP